MRDTGNRRNRAMVLGCLLLCCIWLAGILLLQADNGERAAFRQLWQRSLDSGLWMLQGSTQGGVYAIRSGFSEHALRRYDSRGKLLWQHSLPAPSGWDGLVETEDGRLFQHLQDGSLTCTAPDGTVKWRFVPDSNEYERYLVHDDSPIASCYCPSGVLLWGLDDAGEICWVDFINPGFNFQRLPVWQEFRGQPVFLEQNQFWGRLHFPDGSQRDYKPTPPDPDNPKRGLTTVEPGQELYDVNLIGIFNGQELIFGRSDSVALVSDEGTRWLYLDALEGKGLRYGSGIVSGKELHLLTAAQTGMLAVDDDGKVLWHYPADTYQIAVGSSGDCQVVLTSAADAILESTLRACLLSGRLQDWLQPYLPASFAQGKSRNPANARRLELVREGELLGSRLIGVHGLPQSVNTMVSDGEIVYVLHYGWLTAYARGVE